MKNFGFLALLLLLLSTAAHAQADFVCSDWVFTSGNGVIHNNLSIQTSAIIKTRAASYVHTDEAGNFRYAEQYQALHLELQVKDAIQEFFVVDPDKAATTPAEYRLNFYQRRNKNFLRASVMVPEYKVTTVANGAIPGHHFYMIDLQGVPYYIFERLVREVDIVRINYVDSSAQLPETTGR